MRMPPKVLRLALSVLASLSSQACDDTDPSPVSQTSVVAPPASQPAPAPSASALPRRESPSTGSSASERAGGTPPGVPFEVRPAVQVKHRVAGQQVLNVTVEPGVLLGPRKQFVKVFDCAGPDAPRPDMFGICVGFKSCEAVQPRRGEVLAEISCKGPQLTLQLTRDGARLVFEVDDPKQPLAKRAMTPIELPVGTRPEILPFEQKNLTTYVDL